MLTFAQTSANDDQLAVPELKKWQVTRRGKIHKRVRHVFKREDLLPPWTMTLSCGKGMTNIFVLIPTAQQLFDQSDFFTTLVDHTSKNAVSATQSGTVSVDQHDKFKLLLLKTEWEKLRDMKRSKKVLERYEKLLDETCSNGMNNSSTTSASASDQSCVARFADHLVSSTSVLSENEVEDHADSLDKIARLYTSYGNDFSLVDLDRRDNYLGGEQGEGRRPDDDVPADEVEDEAAAPPKTKKRKVSEQKKKAGGAGAAAGAKPKASNLEVEEEDEAVTASTSRNSVLLLKSHKHIEQFRDRILLNKPVRKKKNTNAEDFYALCLEKIRQPVEQTSRSCTKAVQSAGQQHLHPVGTTSSTTAQNYNCPLLSTTHRPHLPLAELQLGLDSGKYHQGILRMMMHTATAGKIGENMEIRGVRNLNRALDGDVVCVEEILPEEESVMQKTKEPDEDEEKLLESALPDVQDVVKEGEMLAEQTQTTPTATAATASNTNAGSNASRNTNNPTSSNVVRSKSLYRVVGILQRGQNFQQREIAGTIKQNDSSRNGGSTASTSNKEEFRIFVPVDPRIPNVRIPTRQGHLLENKRILVTIDSWELSEITSPKGHWTKILGTVGDRTVESAVILHEHGVRTEEFSTAVYNCLPPSDYEVDVDYFRKNDPNRRDLTDLLTCSVDPPGCKDIDDALSCEFLEENSNWVRVGVHIADVTHFVKPDSAIDKEAQQRCTSVYLVEKRTDMLPSLLTTDLCSLRANVVRLTFSVLWEMNLEDPTQIRKVEFCKAMIKSKAALAYADAQNRINDKSDTTDLTKSLRALNAIAKKLREQRRRNGALELASQEMRFELESETHDPVSVSAYELKDTNRMVEEFMLLANTTVAEKILTHFPNFSILRRHPTPKLDALENLEKLIKNTLGENSEFEFKFQTNKQLADSLDSLGRMDNVNLGRRTTNRAGGASTGASSSSPNINVANQQKQKLVTQLLRVLTTRCMNQATYFCTGQIADRSLYNHYGLAMALYTHFTSPIRRYADVLAHRLLAYAIGYEGSSKVEEILVHNPQEHQQQETAQKTAAGGEVHLSKKKKKRKVAADKDNGDGTTIVRAEQQTTSTGESEDPATQLNKMILPDQLSKDRMTEQCERINLKHRMAQWSGRASSQLHTYLYFQKRGKVEHELAIVMRIQSEKQIFVNIPKYGVEAAVWKGLGEENGWRICGSSSSNGMTCIANSNSSEKLAVLDQVLVSIEADDLDFRNKVLVTFEKKVAEDHPHAGREAGSSSSIAGRAEDEDATIPISSSNHAITSSSSSKMKKVGKKMNKKKTTTSSTTVSDSNLAARDAMQAFEREKRRIQKEMFPDQITEKPGV
ncbi:unnamed protein product [Amoebophrya sp. A120]|nr:unnamed protein product [Amoebophrya sp. A120]|eukprot:GSA120T00022190001.1